MVTLPQLVRVFGGEMHAPQHGASVDLREVQIDSRSVQPGDIFAALPGETSNGTRFVAEAVARGAAAILSPVRIETPPHVSNWVHGHARRVVGEAAAYLHGKPSNEMFVAAVTGTNGKTTTAHLIGQLWAYCGRRPAVLGTAGHRLADGVLTPASHTTPDAPSLQRLLVRHREFGGDCVALEASSHALEQERLAGISVSAAAFTNLTRDHLDYHRDMASYLAAKAKLFESLAPHSCAVINADDLAGSSLAAVARERGARVIKFSTRTRADLWASGLEVDSRGTRFSLEGMGMERLGVSLPLAGRFNVENALAALACVLVSGASPTHALSGLALVSPAPGRLQRVDTSGRDFTVFVDYAHTEDALSKVLHVVREGLVAEGRRRGDHGGRLICVFGCGGDRDSGKRAPMGHTAGSLSDVVIATSDNPRGEDPLAILAEIERGLHGTVAAAHIEPDRRAAIGLALSMARAHDVVLIAGKGHETTQTIAGRVEAFDDCAVAREFLSSVATGGLRR